MKKNIYIFTSKSYQPNLYINILGSCVEQFGIENIEDIYLLKLGTFEDIEKVESSKELKIIRDNILTQLTELSNSKYLLWDKTNDGFVPQALVKVIEVKEEYKDLYISLLRKITEDEIKYKIIWLDELESTLMRIINNPSYEFIFDLTGVPKKDFLNISMILLSRDCSIYTFESFRRFTFDEFDLIHNLLDINKYSKEELSYKHYHLNPGSYKVVKVSTESKISDLKKKWKTELSKDKTTKVIEEVTEYLDKSTDYGIDLQKEIINLARRSHDIISKYQGNIIHKDQYDVEINRVNDALIDVIRKIE